MPIVIRVSLEEDSIRGIFRGIGGDGKWFREIWEVKNGAREEKLFELVEGVLACKGPIPSIVFLC